jgi:hypothetical protein
VEFQKIAPDTPFVLASQKMTLSKSTLAAKLFGVISFCMKAMVA